MCVAVGALRVMDAIELARYSCESYGDYGVRLQDTQIDSSSREEFEKELMRKFERNQKKGSG